MGYYDFPHTRNYDSDLGFLIKRYNEIIERIDGLESNILSQAKDYTDAQLRTYQDQINSLRLELTNRYNDFERIVNAQIELMRTDIERFDALINNKIIDVDNRTDIKIERNNEYLKAYIESQLIDVKVRNPFTGMIVTIQEMFNYLSALHSNAITVNHLISRANTYTEIAAYNMTFTDLFTNGNTIIIQN